MARRPRRVDWPAWRYGPDGQKAMFECPEDVPMGWYVKPQLQYEAPKANPEICKEAVITQLIDNGIKVDPRWGKAKLWEELEKVLGK